MNLVDCYVTKIIGEPYKRYDKWWVSVQYESYGVESDTDLMFDTLDAARAVVIGHHFLA